MSVKEWITEAVERLRDALDALRPQPEPVPIPVRVHPDHRQPPRP